MKALIENEVDITRSTDEVFDYVSDHMHEAEWNPQMRSVRKLTDGPIGSERSMRWSSFPADLWW